MGKKWKQVSFSLAPKSLQMTCPLAWEEGISQTTDYTVLGKLEEPATLPPGTAVLRLMGGSL